MANPLCLSAEATRSTHRAILFTNACVHNEWTSKFWSQAEALPFRDADSAPLLSDQNTTLRPLSSSVNVDSPTISAFAYPMQQCSTQEVIKRCLTSNSKLMIWLSPLFWNCFICCSAGAPSVYSVRPSMNNTAAHLAGVLLASTKRCAGGLLTVFQSFS